MNANELIEKVKEFEDSIAKLTEQVANFRKQLVNAEADEDKKFKMVGTGNEYFCILLKQGKFDVSKFTEYSLEADKIYFKNNNYFLTQERAQEVADKINYLMRLERLHDELCPDFVPDWENLKDGQNNYCIKYSPSFGEYGFISGIASPDFYSKCDAYFPTWQISKKACDILNGELEQTKE